MQTYDQYHEVKNGGKITRLPTNVSGRIGGCWAKGQFYESGVLKHIRKLGLTGTYIDVGMNRGNHTLFFAHLCNSREVLSFEPFLYHIKNAERLLELNGVRDKVRMFNIALSSKKSRIDLSFGNKTTSALTVRLDDISPDGVSLIKIDVEGGEMEVLKGALSTIRKDKPYIIVEIFDESLDETTKFIENLGYKRGRKFKSPTYEFIPCLGKQS